MEKKFLTLKDLFKDIKAREIYNVEYYKDLNKVYKENALSSVENSYKYMKNKLDSAIGSLGLEISKYKNARHQWRIPVEEEEFFIRAYIQSTSPAGKKLRGIKKDELDINEIHREIKSMEELIDREYGTEDSKDKKGFLEYVTNYKILEKINQVKEPINQMILENMENILNWEEDKLRLLNIDDAVYLIEYYKELVENTTKMWNNIVDIFCEIRDSENEVIDYIDNGTEIQYDGSETVLTEAIKIYNKRLRSPKSKDNQRDGNSRINEEYTDEEMKAVKEVLESYLKAGK